MDNHRAQFYFTMSPIKLRNVFDDIMGKEEVHHMPSSLLLSIRSIIPHSGYEINDSCKDYARTKHSRNKKDSSRHNVKEQRGKNCQRRDKWLQQVVKQDKDRKKVLPHAFESAQDSLSAFVQSFTTFVESSPAAQSDAAQAIYHVENLAILIYYLMQARTFDNYIVAIIGYMKCYVKTSLVVLVSEVHRLVMEKPHPIHSSSQYDRENEEINKNIISSVVQLEEGCSWDTARSKVDHTFDQVKKQHKAVMQQIRRNNTMYFNERVSVIDDILQRKKDDIEQFSQEQREKEVFDELDRDIPFLYKDDSSVDTQGRPVEEVCVNHDSCKPESSTLQTVKDAWDMLKINPIFEKISYLITAAMSSSICTFKEISFDIAGVKLIHLEAMNKQVETIDIIDALIATFSWVVETGSACLAEKSLAPILFSDQRLKQYTRDSSETIALAGSAIAGNISDLQLYERKLDELLEETRRIMDVTKSVPIKEMLSRKYIQLRGIKVDLINKRKNTQYRFAPIGFSLFGESSIGKSDVAEITMKTALEAMGEDSSKQGIFTLNDADKYESQYTTDIKGVFIDDANNTASGFVDGAPTARFFRFFNNMSSTALKPDVDSKGNVFIEFKVGVLTTNTKTLGANIYSNYPISILRRFWHVTVEVQDKYQTPGGASLNVNHPDVINCPVDQILDVWQFKIEEAIPDRTNMGHFRIAMYIDDDGKKKACVRLNLQQYLRAIVYFSKQHKMRQDRQVARNTHLENFQCCKQCCMLPQYCKCSNIPHSVNEIYKTISGMIRPMVQQMIMNWVKQSVSGYILDASTLLSPSEQDLSHVLDERALPTTIGWLPDCVTKSPFFRNFVYTYHINRRNPNMTNIRKTALKLVWILSIITLLLIRIFPMWLLIVVLSLLLHLLFIILICDLNLQHENAFLDRLFEEHSGRTLQSYGSFLRNHWSTKYVLTATGLSTIVWVLNVWNKQRRNPQSLTDRHAIDLKPSWFGMTMSTKKAHCSSGIKGAVAMQVASQLDMNLCWGRFTHPDGYVTKCCVFHPRKSIVLFPRHVFYKDANMRSHPADIMECQIFRNMKPGGSYKCKFRFDMVYHFPEMDLVAGYVPNCPDYRDKTKWLVDEQPEGHAVVRIATMEENGDRFCVTTSAVFGRVKHTYMSMMGASYKTDIAHSGSCMSVLVSDTFSPAIVGFHIGGNSLSRTGISCTVTKRQYFDAERWLEDNVAYLSAHATDLPKTQYGISLLTSEEVNPKCKGVVEQMNNPNAVFEPIGSTAIRSEMKSKVEPSILSTHVERHMGITNTFGPPQLRPNWKPFMKNLEVISRPTEPFDPHLLRRAVNDYMCPLVEKMKEYKRDDIVRPLTMRETIMGIPGKRFIDALPMDTGVGFPLFGKKNKVDKNGHPLYFGEVWEEGRLIDRYPLPIILEEVDRILACYKRNERAYPVTVASLKDESTPLEKEKVRVFQAAAIALSILIRMYFLPIARFMCLYPLIAECAVGINAFSQDWQELMDYVLQFADDGKVLAWDFKEYDARMNSQLTRQAWSIFIQFAEFGGYDAASLNIMKAMIVDITHPLIDMNGTMIMATSMNTSGNNMTVMVNSVVNCLYLRMGFFSIYPEKDDFRKYVKYTSYGDDGLGSNLRPETSNFNFATYQNFLANHGIKLTVPTKTDEVVDYLDVSKADFLKRTSKYIPEIDCKIGALDFNSIVKPLLSNLKSSSVTKTEQAASCVETALHELFAHGRDEYELRRAQLQKVCADAEVPVPALAITFDDRVEHWKQKYVIAAEDTSGLSPVVQQKTILYLEESGVENTTQKQQPDMKQTHLIERSESSAHKRTIGESDYNSPAGKKALFLKPQSDYELTADSLSMNVKFILFEKQYLLSAFEQELEHGNVSSPIVERYADQFEEEPYCFWFRLSEREREKLRKLVMKYYKACGIYKNIHDLVPSGYLDDQMFPHASNELESIQPQSDTNEIADGSPAEPELETANVKFHDAHPGFADYRGHSTDILRESMDHDAVSLNNFFARPLKVAIFQWAINTDLNVQFNPWTLFFENPRVINRIANYKNLKATLCVKFVLNGSPMHYGRALASYQPLPLFDIRTVTRANNEFDMILASQRPHIWLNPAVSAGGQLDLPFFTPYNMLDVPSCQWREMGQINVNSLALLKHANAASGDVDLSIFVWAENVVLSGLTQQDPIAIVPQSATELNGILSKPLSSIAKTASHISMIPKLSGLARATEIGAQSLAVMANLFGYSKPSNYDPEFRHVVSVDSMCNTDGKDDCLRLSVDSKQELSIDPLVAGLDSHDEMTVSSIATRESYIARAIWQTAFNPETRLFAMVVDPGIVRRPANGLDQEVYMPACAFAAQPFKYWRGSMKYRFQFCSSGFHKGRVKIVWDPFASFTTSEYNTAYTHIVDISEQNDFTVEIGWGQNTSWRARLYCLQNLQQTVVFSTAGGAAGPLAYNSANTREMGNGAISMYVVNSLTAPNSTVNNDIAVLVSVSCSDDVEFAVPGDDTLRTLSFTPMPAGTVYTGVELPPNLVGAGFGPTTLLARIDEEVIDEKIEPQSANEKSDNMDDPVAAGTVHKMGPPVIMSNEINKIYMGESVLSFRALLKRYNYHETLNTTRAVAENAPRVYVWYRRMFPYWGGRETLPTTNESLAMPITGGTFLPGRTTMLHWLTCAYGGWRGNIRYMLDSSFSGINQPVAWHIYRNDEYDPVFDLDLAFTSFSTINPSQKHVDRSVIDGAYPTGNAAMQIWSNTVNAIQKVEIPYQTNYRFCPAKQGNGIVNIDKFQNSFEWETLLPAGTKNVAFHKYVAAGEDFNLFFYLGPPRFFVRPINLTIA